jgi:hypothetical protein
VRVVTLLVTVVLGLPLEEAEQDSYRSAAVLEDIHPDRRRWRILG